MESVRVESYAGSRAEEYPLRFYMDDRKIEIISIEKRWFTPECNHFQVKGDDGYRYELQYNTALDIWNLLKVN